MSDTPNELRYASSHEWTREENDGTVTVGITNHAQDSLGDVVFVELPEIGRELRAGDECAVVESVKAASDIYAPVSGTVVAINETLADTPELINEDPYGAAWLFRIKLADVSELDALLDAAGYQASI